MNKVTLYKDDFSNVSWFYILRDAGIIESTLDYQDMFIDEDEYGYLLPMNEILFEAANFIELEVNSLTKNF